jgi:DnaJ-domain-containing protein 1
MSTPDHDLRRRADELRSLASRLDRCAAHRAAARSGVDTWRGPVPESVDADLRRLARALADAADELRRTASRLAVAPGAQR